MKLSVGSARDVDRSGEERNGVVCMCEEGGGRAALVREVVGAVQTRRHVVGVASCADAVALQWLGSGERTWRRDVDTACRGDG